MYAKRRLGNLQTLDDAMRWATISYYEVWWSCLYRLIFCWFNDDNIWDILFGPISTAINYDEYKPLSQNRLDLFIDLIHSERIEHKVGAIMLLGKLGDDRAIPHLKEIANSVKGKWDICVFCAQVSIAQITGINFPKTPNPLKSYWLALIEKVRRLLKSL